MSSVPLPSPGLVMRAGTAQVQLCSEPKHTQPGSLGENAKILQAEVSPGALGLCHSLWHTQPSREQS